MPKVTISRVMNRSPHEGLGKGPHVHARTQRAGRSQCPKSPEDALGIFVKATVCSRGSPSASGPASAVPPEHLSHTYKRSEWEKSGDKHSHEGEQRPFWLHPLCDARPGWQGSGKLPGGRNDGEAKEKPQKRAGIKAPVLWSRCKGSDNSLFLPTQELGVSKSSYQAADLGTNKRQRFFRATRD